MGGSRARPAGPLPLTFLRRKIEFQHEAGMEGRTDGSLTSEIAKPLQNIHMMVGAGGWVGFSVAFKCIHSLLFSLDYFFFLLYLFMLFNCLKALSIFAA